MLGSYKKILYSHDAASILDVDWASWPASRTVSVNGATVKTLTKYSDLVYANGESSLVLGLASNTLVWRLDLKWDDDYFSYWIKADRFVVPQHASPAGLYLKYRYYYKWPGLPWYQEYAGILKSCSVS